MQMFHTSVTDEAINNVVEVLRSGFLNEGEVVKKFEQQLAEYIGAPSVVTTNSATAALHLALIQAGAGPGTEVIIPPQTFVATGLAVLHAGAKPIFADVDPNNGNMSPASVTSKLTERTMAAIPVHWGGEPCAMRELHEAVSGSKAQIIEDAAHAFGAKYRGESIGRISKLTCFSFQAIKGLTTGDGGAIAVLDNHDRVTLTRRRWFGMLKGEAPPSVIGERSAAIETLGYKYHMNNVAASIGLGNLAGFGARLERRRLVAERYIRELEATTAFRHICRDPLNQSSHWLFPVLVERREDFGRAMKSRDIPVSVIDRRIDLHPIFGGVCRDLPGVDYFDTHQIHLPIHEGLTDEDVGAVIDAVKAGW